MLTRPPWSTACCALLLLCSAGAHAQDNSVGVVAVGNSSSAASFKKVAQVAVAIRAALKSRGRKVIDPAVSLQGKDIPLPGLALKAQKELILATSHYDGLAFGKARAGFQEAVKSQRQAVQYGSPVKDYIKAMQYLAASAFYDGDRAAAIGHFGELLAFDSAAKPDEGVFSPDVLKIYQEATAMEWKKGSMKLQSTPCAEVYINGKFRGISPLTIKGLVPAHYLVKFRSPGHDAVVQWSAVEQDGVAEVRSELKEGPQYKSYAQAVLAVTSEVKSGRPGPTVNRLKTLLGASSLILVSKRGKQVQATWARDKYWVKQYRGTVAARKAAAFAGKFLASRAPVAVKAQCRSTTDCPSGKQCAGGRCVTRGGRSGAVSTPIYKKWWFWTIVGVVVVGTTTGVVIGTMPGNYTAQVAPGVGP